VVSGYEASSSSNGGWWGATLGSFCKTIESEREIKSAEKVESSWSLFFFLFILSLPGC